MLQKLPEDLFLSQKIAIKRKYNNRELYLYQYFLKTTKIHPKSVFVYNNSFIFFFVKSEDYFRSGGYQLRAIRKKLPNNKVLIIRASQTLIKLIYSFFPDVYIHDIELSFNKKTNERTITVGFLSFQERGIAIGRQGVYIKAINMIFQKYVKFKDSYLEGSKIKVQCETMDLKNQY